MLECKNEPMVSIIVPVYNCEAYVEKCICSILNQSYKDCELLVVNDGSTDQSDKVIRNLIARTSGIRYFVQDNLGCATARNAAVEKAHGKYLLFIDADDYIDVDYVSDLVECAEAHDSELVISGYTVVYAEKSEKKEVIPGKYISFEAEEWAYRISSTWGRMYKKDFWKKYQLCFVQEQGARAEDVPVALFSNAMARNIQLLPNAGYYYVQRPGSAMNNHEQEIIFTFPYVAFKQMYEKVMQLSPGNSKAFFDMGVLKFLAQFEFDIYRHAPVSEKKKFRSYVRKLLGDRFSEMTAEWKIMKKKVEIPAYIKWAIQLFLIKYGSLYRVGYD